MLVGSVATDFIGLVQTLGVDSKVLQAKAYRRELDPGRYAHYSFVVALVLSRLELSENTYFPLGSSYHEGLSFHVYLLLHRLASPAPVALAPPMSGWCFFNCHASVDS